MRDLKLFTGEVKHKDTTTEMLFFNLKGKEGFLSKVLDEFFVIKENDAKKFLRLNYERDLFSMINYESAEYLLYVLLHQFLVNYVSTDIIPSCYDFCNNDKKLLKDYVKLQLSRWYVGSFRQPRKWGEYEYHTSEEDTIKSNNFYLIGSGLVTHNSKLYFYKEKYLKELPTDLLYVFEYNPKYAKCVVKYECMIYDLNYNPNSLDELTPYDDNYYTDENYFDWNKILVI